MLVAVLVLWAGLGLGCKVKGGLPWYAQIQLRLHSDEPGEDTQTDRRRGQDDEDPEVELEFGPVVAAVGDSSDGHCFFFLYNTRSLLKVMYRGNAVDVDGSQVIRCQSSGTVDISDRYACTSINPVDSILCGAVSKVKRYGCRQRITAWTLGPGIESGTQSIWSRLVLFGMQRSGGYEA